MIYETLGIDLSKSYGFDFDHYDIAKLPELTEEEKNKWYSKFYYQGRPDLPEELKKVFAKDNPMDPKNALLPGSFDLLAQQDEITEDIGYSLLENGVGYGSVHATMDGINLEMFGWYRTLRMVDQLSYKIWYPGAHYSELRGTTIENIGFGNSDFLTVSRLDPEMLGFTVRPSEADPRFTFIMGGNAVMKNRDYPEIKPISSALFHYVRTLEDGSLDFRTHFFIGGMIADGKLIRLQHIDPEVCLEIARRMCSHCIYERKNVQNVLPEIYERRAEFDLSAAEKMQGDLRKIR